MKSKGPILLIAALSIPLVSQAQIVGFANLIFRPGDNLFGNPLSNTETNNHLSGIMPIAPNGATISLWNAGLGHYDVISTFLSGAWSLDLSLAPGQGALLHTASIFTNTFVGQVLAPDGSPLFNEAGIVPPPPFVGGSGVFLLSSKFPGELSSALRPVFQYVLGRNPYEGEQYTTLDALTQTYLTTTFTSGAWNNGDPVLHVGQAAFFTLVPEPSSIALALIGLCAFRVGRRSCKKAA